MVIFGTSVKKVKNGDFWKMWKKVKIHEIVFVVKRVKYGKMWKKVIFGYSVEMLVFQEFRFLDTGEVSNIGYLGPWFQGSHYFHVLFSGITHPACPVFLIYSHAGWGQWVPGGKQDSILGPGPGPGPAVIRVSPAGDWSSGVRVRVRPS